MCGNGDVWKRRRAECRVGGKSEDQKDLYDSIGSRKVE